MTRDILLSQAIEGFIVARQADGYSPDTLSQYRWGLKFLSPYFSLPIGDLTVDQLRTVLAGVQGRFAPQSIFHIWKAIRALFKWASAEGLIYPRPDTNLRMPRFQRTEVQPLTQDEMKKLLCAIERTVPSTGRRHSFTMSRATRLRDKAILLTFLDTGIRASELSRLELRDLDLAGGTIAIRPHRSGLKSRGRVIPLGKVVRTAIWRYHAERGSMRPNEPVFATLRGKPMARNALLYLLIRMGERAGVANVHPHRLRHTFAIQFLRNGGDVFTLQRLLGHNSLDMVGHYLALAQADDENAHRLASPADRWMK